jgi:putative holliday junction resolvase
MGRIIAIDYGQKRVGIAVTDELKLIATGLTVLNPNELMSFLKNYILQNNVDAIVVGEPRQMNNTASESSRFIEPFLKNLKKTFPDIPIHRMDERFTSRLAQSAILMSGIGKKDRQNKELTDKVSATIILQSFMEQEEFFKSKKG